MFLFIHTVAYFAILFTIELNLFRANWVALFNTDGVSKFSEGS